MTTSADRLSGAFFLLFGLCMYFVVIPNYVEFVDEGNISPATMPNYLSIIIAVCGGVLLIRPTQYQTQDVRYFMIAAAYVAILSAGIYAMSLFGFEYVGPVLALAIMLMIGERRPAWLLAGSVVMPFMIWFLVVFVLARALP